MSSREVKRVREWQLANPEKTQAAKRRWQIKMRAPLKEFVDRAKSAPCVDCHKRFPPIAMDFDHIRGEKSMDISKMIIQLRPLEEIEEEIKKCDLVCANCHRIRTGSRYPDGTSLLVILEPGLSAGLLY